MGGEGEAEMGYPPDMGYLPRPEMGYPPTQTWDWVPPYPDLRWGTPPDLRWGPPHSPHPRHGMGYPPIFQTWLGCPPPKTWDGVPPLWTDTQTRVKTLPSRRTTYAGGNEKSYFPGIVYLRTFNMATDFIKNLETVFSVFVIPEWVERKESLDLDSAVQLSIMHNCFKYLFNFNAISLYSCIHAFCYLNMQYYFPFHLHITSN